jgi:hypothetical protein
MTIGDKDCGGKILVGAHHDAPKNRTTNAKTKHCSRDLGYKAFEVYEK